MRESPETPQLKWDTNHGTQRVGNGRAPPVQVIVIRFRDRKQFVMTPCVFPADK